MKESGVPELLLEMIAELFAHGVLDALERSALGRRRLDRSREDQVLDDGRRIGFRGQEVAIGLFALDRHVDVAVGTEITDFGLDRIDALVMEHDIGSQLADGDVGGGDELAIVLGKRADDLGGDAFGQSCFISRTRVFFADGGVLGLEMTENLISHALMLLDGIACELH